MSQEQENGQSEGTLDLRVQICYKKNWLQVANAQDSSDMEKAEFIMTKS